MAKELLCFRVASSRQLVVSTPKWLPLGPCGRARSRICGPDRTRRSAVFY